MEHYNVLGVDVFATPEQIKAAYRKMAQSWHPDKHKGDKNAEARFKKINDAWECLKDPERRARYDRGEDDKPNRKTEREVAQHEAYQVVGNVLQHVFQKQIQGRADNAKYLPVVEVMRDLIHTDRRNARKNMKDLRGTVAAAREMLRRLDEKDGVIANALGYHLNGMLAQYRQNRHAALVLSETINLLADSKYNADYHPGIVRSGFSQTTTGTGSF